MTSQLSALCLDADDPLVVARFWRTLLGWVTADHSQTGITVQPTDDTGFCLRVRPSQEPKTGLNQVHLHLTSTSLEDQQRSVARALELGARAVDVGQRPEEGHIVLADPEGNEFCVIEPGNKFLAGCGFLAELACDGSQQVGYFWSAALGWPLNWDQDQETSIRSPHGGPKISWGGPPFTPGQGKDRFHFDLTAGGDLQAETERLLSLGATRAGAGPGEAGRVILADPDGHDFCLLAPR